MQSPPDVKANKFHRWPAILTIAMLIVSPLAASPAQAGPDDGKPIATQTHIDGPKVFWENNNFFLRTEGKFDGIPKAAKPMQEVVNWVGQGYSTRGEPQFMYTVPDAGGEGLAFLGAPGDTWYQAPKVNVNNLDPIWIGMGADAALPVDMFRDGTASIDLLSVDGPGQVEWLSSWLWDGHWESRRILSSADPTRRSHKVTAGTHGHMDTLFSKPGRYTMTYQASARLHDGTLVQSEPQQQFWQVGGKRPGKDVSQPLADQFNQSVKGIPTTPYKLSYSSAQASETEARMDEKLTDIVFSAAPDVSGTLTLFVDGYFHTEIPVIDGKATARELMGTAKSSVQGVFIPASGGTSDAPAYVLDSAEFSHGNKVLLTSDGTSAALPVPVRHDAPTVSFVEQAPTSLGYSASVKPLGDNRYQADVKFDDPDIRAFMSGGIYDSPQEIFPTLSFSGETGPTHISEIFAWDAEYDGTLVKISISPHPASSIKPFTIELPDVLPVTSPFVIRGEADAETSAIIPGPTPGLNTIVPTPPTKAEPGEVCTNPDDRVQLGKGHVDLKALHSPGNGLSMVLADETAQVDQHAVDRDPNTVTLVVSSAARSVRLPAFSGTEYDFLGPVGTKFYRLPQTQEPNIIWPGWNTLDVDYSELEGGVQLQLRGIHAPDGGEIKVFTTDSLGRPSLLLDSAGSKKSIDIAYATHTHADWVFSTAGTYELTLAFAAKSKNGSPLVSREHTLRVVVDQPVAATCPPAEVPQHDAPAPASTPSSTPILKVIDQPQDSDHGPNDAAADGNEPSGEHLSEESLEAIARESARSDSNVTGLAVTGTHSVAILSGSLLLLVAGGMLLLFRRRAH